MAGLPARYGSLLCWTAFLTLVSCFCPLSLSPPPTHTHTCLPCLLSFCFSPFLSFSIYQLFLLLFPLSFISCYSCRFLFCPSYTTQTLLPCPSLPYFSTQRLHLPSQYQCYQIVHCSQLPHLLVFALSFTPHHYVSFCLPAVHLVILQWSSAGLELLSPPLVYVKIFYDLLY